MAVGRYGMTTVSTFPEETVMKDVTLEPTLQQSPSSVMNARMIHMAGTPRGDGPHA